MEERFTSFPQSLFSLICFLLFPPLDAARMKLSAICLVVPALLTLGIHDGGLIEGTYLRDCIALLFGTYFSVVISP